MTKLNEMTAAQWNWRHDAIKRHARLDGDDRRAHGAAGERDGRTMKSEIEAIRMDMLKEIRFNSTVSTPVLLAKRNRIAANVREVSVKIDWKGPFGTMFEVVKYVAHHGLYCDRRAPRKLDPLVVRHIGDRPEDRKFKVLPTRALRPALRARAAPVRRKPAGGPRGAARRRSTCGANRPPMRCARGIADVCPGRRTPHAAHA